MSQDCPICARHRDESALGGALVLRRDGFWVWHAQPDSSGTTALGHLIIESDRHAPYMADLSNEEAAALGPLRSRLAEALRAETGAELVLAAVIGMGAAHFHEHLFCRFQGTDRAVPWHESDEAAPRADGAAIADLAGRIRERLGA